MWQEGAQQSHKKNVLMFYGTLSHHLWWDSLGRVLTITQGEGGEHGDAMMPLLFSLGRHAALERVQRSLHGVP